MATAAPDERASVPRVAKWLLDKGRPDDAVSLLSAWAASGPNDKTGQELLAEAFRIDPSAAVARMAFERMEGITGEHSILEAAFLKFAPAEFTKLEGEMKRPSFRRAQVGFNNNIKYKAHVYHVQTEDSGLDKPHIITHLFADGGRVIKSHKRTYAAEVNRPDVTPFVRALMKGQHMEMVLCLREGKFDLVIEGKAMGGMTLLEHPPQVDVKKMGPSKVAADAPPGDGVPAAAATDAATDAAPRPVTARGSAPPPALVATPEPAPAKEATARAPRGPSERPIPFAETAPMTAIPDPRGAAPVRFRLNVLRSLAGGPLRYEPRGDEVVLGSAGGLQIVGEKFCHPREGAFRWKSGRLSLEDFAGGNGVFLRVRTPCELELGDEFIVGDHLLRVVKNPVAQNGPDPGPTYFYSSPTWVSAFRIVQVFQGGALGGAIIARGTTVVIGSQQGDFLLKGDPLVGDQHCMVEEQAGVLVITDLGSRTGTFVRIRGEQEIAHGDELLIGRTRLVVDMAAAK